MNIEGSLETLELYSALYISKYSKLLACHPKLINITGMPPTLILITRMC
jgi:hypothetical protein